MCFFPHSSFIILAWTVIFLTVLVLLGFCLVNFVLVLLMLDMLLLCNIVLFIVSAAYTNSEIGYISAVIVLGVAAADTAVGLGLFILYFRSTQTISIIGNKS